MEILLDGLKKQLDTAEEKISKLKSMETYKPKHTEKNILKTKKNESQ